MEQLIAAVLVVVPLGGAGLVAWGRLHADLKNTRKDVDAKASKELVSAQYSEIIHRLERIERNLNGSH